MATIQIYGIDADYVASFYPQIEVSGAASITAARLATMVESASSRVNGVLVAHGLDPDNVNDNATASSAEATTFHFTKTMVVQCIGPLIDVALLASPSVQKASEALCLARLQAFEASPQISGASTETMTPGSSSSTAYLGIEISDSSRAIRRKYGAGWNGF